MNSAPGAIPKKKKLPDADVNREKHKPNEA